MSDSIITDPSLAALQEDMAALKRDFSSLLGHIKSTATTSAQNAAGQIEDGASRLYRNASNEGYKSAKALSAQIEEQPALALLIALGIGYVGGRLLAR